MTAKELANKETLTTREKRFLKYEAERLGIVPVIYTGCENCYRDLAVQIYAKEKADADADADARFVLNDGVDIIFGRNGVRVNAATLTDDIAERLIKAGHTRLFKKYDTNNL